MNYHDMFVHYRLLYLKIVINFDEPRLSYVKNLTFCLQKMTIISFSMQLYNLYTPHVCCIKLVFQTKIYTSFEIQNFFYRYRYVNFINNNLATEFSVYCIFDCGFLVDVYNILLYELFSSICVSDKPLSVLLLLIFYV